MQVFYGSSYASNFHEFGQQYRVIIQADTNYRATPAGLNKIGIRTSTGSMSPINEFVTLTRVYGSWKYNQVQSVYLYFNKWFSQWWLQHRAIIGSYQEVATQTLTGRLWLWIFRYQQEEHNSGSQTLYIFVYVCCLYNLLLSATIRKYLFPFAVLFTLPVGLTGYMCLQKYLDWTIIFTWPDFGNHAYWLAGEKRNSDYYVRLGKKKERHDNSGVSYRRSKSPFASYFNDFHSAFVFGLMPLMFASV